MIIAVSGQDGSGKSFIVSELINNFEANGTSVKKVEFKKYFFIDNIFNKIRPKPDSNKLNKYLNPNKKNIKPYHKIWPFVVFLLDYIYYIFVLLPVSTKQVVICDRFFVDRLVGFHYYGYLNKTFFKLLLFLSPKPANYFVLQCSPQQSLERETGEKHSINFYIDLRKIYLMASKFKKVSTVDSSKQKHLVVREIVNRVQ